jgi:hypothetical protein
MMFSFFLAAAGRAGAFLLCRRAAHDRPPDQRIGTVSAGLGRDKPPACGQAATPIVSAGGPGRISSRLRPIAWPSSLSERSRRRHARLKSRQDQCSRARHGIGPDARA